jgi:hypothetical protein
MLGINAPSGFGGNFIDLHNNGGATMLEVTAFGAVIAGRGFQTGSATFGFEAAGFANSGLYSSASGTMELGSADTLAGSVAKLVLGGVQSGGTTFTSSGGCSESGLTGGATAGSFTAGSVSCATTITMGNSIAATNGWTCTVYDETTPADSEKVTAHTTTTVTFSVVAVLSDKIIWGCQGW